MLSMRFGMMRMPQDLPQITQIGDRACVNEHGSFPRVLLAIGAMEIFAELGRLEAWSPYCNRTH